MKKTSLPFPHLPWLLLLVFFLGAGPSHAQEFVVTSEGGPPSLAFDGTRYLVASGGQGWRILPDGTLLDPDGLDWEIPVDPDPHATDPSIVALAGSGTDFTAVYKYSATFCISPLICTYRNYLGKASISPDGTPLASGTIFGGEDVFIGRGDIVFGGTQYLLSWAHAGELGTPWNMGSIQGSLFPPGSGGVDLYIYSSANPQMAGAGQQQAVFVDGRYLLAWVSYYPHQVSSDPPVFERRWRIAARRVQEDGTFLDPEFVTLLGPLESSVSMAVACGSPHCLVAWEDGDSIRGMRVTGDLEVIDPDGFVIRPEASPFSWSDPTVGSDGSGFLVLWVDEAYPGATAIYGAPVSPDADVGTPFRISGLMETVGSLAVAYDGARYLVVWMQQVGASWEIHGAFLLPPTTDDPDGDGVGGGGDNCPEAYNPLQFDGDGDGFGERCDCEDANPDIHPGMAEICDDAGEADEDCDGLANAADPDCAAPPWGAASTLSGARIAQAGERTSTGFNMLAMFALPCGAFVLWRIRRRKR